MEDKAWDVPNSRAIIVMKNENKFYYLSNENKISLNIFFKIKNLNNNIDNNCLLKTYGSDVIIASENLMEKVNKMAEFIFNDVIPIFNKNDNFFNKRDYWNCPKKEDDFEMISLKSLAHLYSVKDKCELKHYFLHYKGEHACYVSCIGKEVNGIKQEIFMGKPEFTKEEAVNSSINMCYGTLSILEKIQNMSWNLMLDNNHPENIFKIDKFYNYKIEEIKIDGVKVDTISQK